MVEASLSPYVSFNTEAGIPVVIHMQRRQGRAGFAAVSEEPFNLPEQE
jgi:hypothetical protein